MSEGYVLVVLLFLLYLSECFVLIRKNSIAFSSPWGRGWKVVFSDSLLGNSRASLILLNPLFPLGRVFVGHLSPISVSPDGVCAFNPQSFSKIGRAKQSTQFFRFDQITRCSTDGKYLNIDKARLLECSDSEQSRALADLINAAVDASHADREKLIRGYIAKRFAADKAALRLDREKFWLKQMRISCFIFFVLLYLVVPVLVSLYGVEPLFVPTALTMFMFALYIAVMFYFIHSALYPRSRQDRWLHLLKMVFCPPGAIRAADVLTANLLSAYDPVIIATLLRSSDTDEFVYSYVRDLKFPIRAELTVPFSREVTRWYRAQLLECVQEHLQKAGYHEAPRPVVEEECASYCPRCLGQFRITSGQCMDCPGVSLIACRGTSTEDPAVQNDG
jgi:hypothetical protein